MWIYIAHLIIKITSNVYQPIMTIDNN